jgi:PTH1 family peptidyl-tRNA hydrolase
MDLNSMKYLIVGLGNPGKEYINNRHNVGFMFLDYVITSMNLKPEWEYSKKFNGEYMKYKNNVFLKPFTFMNDSGKSIANTISFYNIDNSSLIVIYDDLDIQFGEYKITKKTPKGHNGILSVMAEIKQEAFLNIRVGINNRSEHNEIIDGNSGKEYVLSNFSIEESLILQNTVFAAILQELKIIIDV